MAKTPYFLPRIAKSTQISTFLIEFAHSFNRLAKISVRTLSFGQKMQFFDKIWAFLEKSQFSMIILTRSK